ncbi:hypothetical protein HWA77_16885 [Photobacterium damselae subsp. damselae]|uniref:Uncharacterized protein n=1 Tax=Photobacterium damselae subsp. damselae TaxID=85581 RepID=A0A850QTT0_PHODD|nr:hypothetical protein [Photobacterium damselae subsp. damselae]
MGQIEQNMIDSVQRAVIDEYEVVVHWYNMWCREVAEREIKRKNKLLSGKEKTCYELNIKITEKSFSIYWQDVLFVQTGTKKRRLTTHIPFYTKQSTQIYYHPNQFSRASSWELELILQTEQRLIASRNRLNHLSNIIRSLSYYNKYSSNEAKFKPLKDVIDLSLKKSIAHYKN